MSGDFVESDNCAGSTISAGGSCAISVSFQPTAAGSRLGRLRIVDNFDLVPPTVSLSGTGLASLPALTITTTSLPGGFVGGPYAATLAASNGVAPYTWSLPSGTLPLGLTFQSATGLISGTPTQVGTTDLTVQVTDSEVTPATAETQLSLTVTAPSISADPTTLSISKPGSSGTTTLTVSGFVTSQIKFSCSGLPNEAICSFGSLTGAGSSQTTKLQITTVATSAPAFILELNGDLRPELTALTLSGLTAIGCLFIMPRRQLRWKILGFILVLSAGISLSGCSGRSSGRSGSLSNAGTPTGTSTVTVTATAGNQSATLSLTVTVQ